MRIISSSFSNSKVELERIRSKSGERDEKRDGTGRFMKGTTMRQDKCSQQALTTIGDVFKFKHIIFTEYQQYKCKKMLFQYFIFENLNSRA